MDRPLTRVVSTGSCQDFHTDEIPARWKTWSGSTCEIRSAVASVSAMSWR